MKHNRRRIKGLRRLQERQLNIEDMNYLAKQLHELDRFAVEKGLPLDLLGYHRNNFSRRIYINKTVDENFMEDVVMQFKHLCDLSDDPIEIYINTPGGRLDVTNYFCYLLDTTTVPVHLINTFECSSAGAFMMMAGYNNPKVTKSATTMSTFLIHELSCGNYGKTSVQMSQFLNTINIQNKLWNYVLTHSKISEADIDANGEKEWYLSAEEALQFGIIDNILN